MDTSYGKLVVTEPGGTEREFELGRKTVTLGRATTNDVVLSDGRASRNHARLECSASRCEIIDLGSSNGTRVNGLRVERAELNAGDLISLGNAQIRYQPAAPSDASYRTVIESPADAELTLDAENLPMSIRETDAPQLVVFALDRTWAVSLEDADALSIGRADDCALVVPHASISRRHAEVARRGNQFVLRDLGSTNGTWFRGAKVTERALLDGDVFRVGRAQVVFKAGAVAGSMTMMGDALALGSARRPVVFVPGLMGSELWLGSERLWPNVRTMINNPEVYRYPSAVAVEPRALVDEIVIIPNLIKQDQYNRLGDYLVEDLGYERGKDFFEFPYDWRQDVRTSARQLGELIDGLGLSQPVTLMGHSLGTLVSRYYVEVLGGKRCVQRLVLMGGPHSGAVKGLTSLLLAPKVLPFGLLGDRLRDIMATFVTSYQILPTYPVAKDQHGNPINFLEDEAWIDEKYLPHLRAARQFRKELGRRSTVPTISIFGYGIKTISNVTVQRREDGKLTDVSYRCDPTGDSSVLEKSAVLTDTEIHPVQQYHGSLFVDADVRMRLRLELTRPLE